MGGWKVRWQEYRPSRSNTSKAMQSPRAADGQGTRTPHAGDLDGSKHRISYYWNAESASLTRISGATTSSVLRCYGTSPAVCPLGFPGARQPRSSAAKTPGQPILGFAWSPNGEILSPSTILVARHQSTGL